MNDTTLNNFFVKEIKKLQTLFNQHNVEAPILFGYLIANKDRIIKQSTNILQLPNYVCNIVKNNNKDIIIRLDNNEKELLKTNIEKVITEYENIVNENKKQYVKFSVYAKILNKLPELLRKKEINLNVSKMKYTINNLTDEIIRQFLRQHLVESKLRLIEKPTNETLENILNLKIYSPKVTILFDKIQNNKKIESTRILEVKEEDIERYKRLKEILNSKQEDKNILPVIRRFLKQKVSVHNTKGLIVKLENNDYLIIGMHYITTTTKIIAQRKSDEIYRKFLNNHLRHLNVGIKPYEMQILIQILTIASDLRMVVTQ